MNGLLLSVIPAIPCFLITRFVIKYSLEYWSNLLLIVIFIVSFLPVFNIILFTILLGFTCLSIAEGTIKYKLRDDDSIRGKFNRWLTKNKI